MSGLKCPVGKIAIVTLPLSIGGHAKVFNIHLQLSPSLPLVDLQRKRDIDATIAVQLGLARALLKGNGIQDATARILIQEEFEMLALTNGARFAHA